jgi:hypothetical protein
VAGTAAATVGVVNRAMNKGDQPPEEQQPSIDASQQAEINQLQSQVAAMQTSAPQAQGQATHTSGQDPISQLKELAQLKEAGVLTQEEFEQQKARILSN